MNILGIIPARGGSKRLPGKNIRLIAGKPLVAHSIEAGLKSKYINKVIVSTEDPKIAEIAASFGAEIIMRPPELAQDTTKTAPVMIHVVEELEKQGYSPDIVVLLQPTTPLRDQYIIDEALLKLISSDNDSIFSGSKIGKTMPLWKRGYDGRLAALYDYHFRPRYQEPELMEDMYAENGAFYAIKIDAFKRCGDFLGENVEILETPGQIDIDTQEDFERAEKILSVRTMFDSIAHKYDLLNNIISFGLHKRIKKHSISSIPVPKGGKVLDLCTGTGDMAILLSDRHQNDDIRITAADFSEKMLEIARKKAGNRTNIDFIQANALRLPFPDEHFDAVFISFGLRNLPDLQRGLLEIKRVLKPGGYLANIDTGKPAGLAGLLFRFYFFRVVPLLGKAYKYLPESTKNFPSQQKLVEILRNIGFQDVKNRDYAFGAIVYQVAVKP